MLVPAGKEVGTGDDASASSFSSLFFFSSVFLAFL